MKCSPFLLAAALALPVAASCGRSATASRPQGDSVGNANPSAVYDPYPYLGTYAGQPVSVYLAVTGGEAKLDYQGREIQLHQIGWMACAGCEGEFGDGDGATTSRIAVILTRLGAERRALVQKLALPLPPANGDSVGNASDVPPALAGRWGGRGIALRFDAGAAFYELDCAHGTIDGPVTLDRQGTFSAKGVLVREHGGPSRPGEPVDRHPTLNTGSIDGTGALTLTIELTDSQPDPYTYTLKAGDQGWLTKCL